MAVALRIARLHNQLQLPAEGLEEGLERSWLQELSQRSLPAALVGVAERAQSRAGLPPEAVVAVRRLNLRIRVGEGASEAALLRAWSQALEEALVRSLGRVRPSVSGPIGNSSELSGDAETSQEVVVFADAWAAEAAHLRGVLSTGRPAWWAERLLDGRGEPLDLSPAAILRRWLERQPARAVAAMAQLADLPPMAQGVSALLQEAAALELAEALVHRLSQRPGAELALPAVGSPLRALLETALERLRRHTHLGPAAIASPARSLPWRLALLLRAQPSLSLLSPPTLLAVADALAAEPPLPLRDDSGVPPLQGEPSPWDQAQHAKDSIDVEDDNNVADSTDTGDVIAAAQGPRGNPSDDTPRPPMTRPGAPPAPLPAPGAMQPQVMQPQPVRQQAWIHAGGLLLLLNRPGLLPQTQQPNGEEPSPSAAGDLALLALYRLLAPLAPGERAAALQRERPLLALLAPDRPWPERLANSVVDQPEAAERQLAALIAAIPEGVAFAPGALRQVYGPRHGASPPLPDRDSHRLAALLWRPGLLSWDRWQITLTWPLPSADGALRRQGWDLDPGWQPALRRMVRFHYRADVQPAQEEQP